MLIIVPVDMFAHEQLVHVYTRSPNTPDRIVPSSLDKLPVAIADICEQGPEDEEDTTMIINLMGQETLLHEIADEIRTQYCTKFWHSDANKLDIRINATL